MSLLQCRSQWPGCGRDDCGWPDQPCVAGGEPAVLAAPSVEEVGPGGNEGRHAGSCSLFQDAYTETLVLANVAMCQGFAKQAIEAGEPPLLVIDQFLGYITGFLSGRTMMVTPPAMIPPEELAAAVAYGQELAARFGW